MKILLFIFLSSFQCFSQEPQGAIESTELNLLYIGYPNQIVVAVSNNDNREVVLSGSSNLTISENQYSEGYIVKTKLRAGKTANLTVGLLEGDSVLPVRTVQYRLMHLPDPTLYWSGVKQEGKANIRSRKLFAKYPPEIPINAYFKILDWKLEWNGEQVTGEGSNLSSGEDLLKKIQEETTVLITTTVIGPDGVERVLSAKWKVKPWDETEPELIIIECGG